MMSVSNIYDEMKWLNTDAEDDGFEGPYLRVDHSINRKIYLFMGEVWKLPVDAIVIGQNENVTDRSECSQIFSLAGPQFEEDANKQAPILTGSSIICSGANLCPFIIISACPKFTQKYEMTAHNSLYFAYKKALLLAAEEPSIRAIAFTCLYLRKSKFPRDLGAHIALRTIRRFLEHDIGKKFERVILAVPSEDFELYKLLIKGYFSRNSSEALMQPELLPEDIGDEWGELTTMDRTLSITAGPKPVHEKPIDPELLEKLKRNEKLKTGQKELAEVPWPIPKRMTELVPDVDQQRIDKISKDMAEMTREERLQLKHQFLVAEAREEDLSDVVQMNFIEIAGRDRLGRHIVLITAANIKVPEEEVELKDRMILYIINRMEQLKGEDYVILYACAGFKTETSPDVDWIGNVFDIFATMYSTSLKQLYILHATMMIRLYMLFQLPFLSNAFWKSYICVENLKGLLTYAEVSSLKLTPTVVEYDKANYPNDHRGVLNNH